MDREEKIRKTYFEIFVFGQILCFSPVPKPLLFFLPLVGILWFLKRNPLKYSFERLFLLFFFCLAYGLFFIFFKRENFFIVNYSIALLFYASFAFFFIAKPPKNFSIEYFNRKYIPVIKWIIVFESVIGISQVLLANKGLDLSSGDYVQGTINILSFINGENGFANVFFVINMTTLVLVYYFLDIQKKRWVFFLGCAAILLASTIHLSLALIGAILVSYFSINPVKIIKVLIPGILFFTLLFLLFPRNFSSLSSYRTQILESRNLKVKSSRTTLEALRSSPKDLLFGYGLGQYSSRSSLIGSGNYFYNKDTKKFRRPLGITNETEIFTKNLKKNWVASITNEGYGFSVMNKPVYSVLSIISETGVLISSIFFFFFSFFIYKVLLGYKKTKEKLLKKKYILILFLTFFLVGISFFENYLEMAQAIFSTLIFIKVLSTTHNRN